MYNNADRACLQAKKMLKSILSMRNQLSLNIVKFLKEAYIILLEDRRIADHFFIILQGTVHITKEVQVAGDEHSDILGPGDFFGVVSTMSGHRHIEAAQAVTDVTLIVVHQNQFGQLIQDNAPVVIKILLQFSRRMRYLNESLTMLTIKKNVNSDLENLFNVAAYYVKQGQYYQAYYAYRQYIKYCPNGKNVQLAQEHFKKITPHIKPEKLEYKNFEMTRTYPKDTMIFAQGEPGEDIFIIKDGSVKIVEIAGDSEVLLAILKAGDIFGEMAVLESKPRGASAVAYEECQLMVVNKINFYHMIKTQPQLIARLTTMLAERIWLLYRQLANLRISDSLGRMYDMLLIHLERKKVNFTSKRHFIFDFGIKELINMVGLSQGDGNVALQKLMQIKCVDVIQNKICVTDVLDFSKHAFSYRKRLEIEKVRRARPQLYISG